MERKGLVAVQLLSWRSNREWKGNVHQHDGITQKWANNPDNLKWHQQRCVDSQPRESGK